MRMLRLTTLVALVALALAPRVDAAHPKIEALDAEWARIEGELEALELSNANAKVPELNKAIVAGANELKAMPPEAKKDPAYMPCAKRGQALLARFQARIQELKAEAAKANAASKAGGVSKSADNALRNFDMRFRQVWGRFTKLQIKDIAREDTAEKWEQEIATLERSFEKLDPAHPSYAAVEQNMEKLRSSWEAAKAKVPNYEKEVAAARAAQAKKLGFTDQKNLRHFGKEYERFLPAFNDIDLVTLQDPKQVENLRWKIDRLKKILNKIEKQDNERVQKAWGVVEGLEEGFQRVLKERDEVAAKAGNVDAQLATLRENFSRESFQPALEEPYTVEKVTSWAESIQDWEKLHEEGVKFLNKAAQFSLKARTPDFKAYHRWFANDVKRRLDEAREAGVRAMQASIEASLRSWKLSESNLADEGFVQRVVDDMEESKETARALNSFYEIYEGEKKEKWTKAYEDLEAKRQRAIGGAQEVLEKTRMPEPKSTSPALLAVAEEELAKEKHGFGEAERIVITSPIQRYKQLVYEDEGFYLRKWKTFQVAFAEQDGDEYWITNAMFKRMKQGAPGDTLGRWYITNRGTFRSRKILEENIHK